MKTSTTHRLNLRYTGQMVKLFLSFFLVIGLSAESASDWFKLGLESFRLQKNEEASAYFRKALDLDNKSNDAYYLYLGVVEHERRRFESAEMAYNSGIELNGPFGNKMKLNRANLRVDMGKLDLAHSDYSDLMNTALRASALLGRANMNLNRSAFPAAVKDYTEYLKADPASRQKSTIEKIIALLTSRQREKEEAEELARKRAFEEERRRLAEEARLAEERARRRRLMDEVLQSLSGSGEDTTSIGAGSEDLREEFEESELED